MWISLTDILGQFVIFELGVFVDLEGTVIALFRGVQYHGGCAPRAKYAGAVIPDWAYRVVFVTYPKAAVYLALGTYILGSLRTVKQAASTFSSSLRLFAHVYLQCLADLPVGSEEDAATDVGSSELGDMEDGARERDDVSRRYLCIGPDLLDK